MLDNMRIFFCVIVLGSFLLTTTVCALPQDRADEIRRSHWAFQPIQRTQPPPVADQSWPKGAIDRFVMARLEAAGLSPSDRADRRTLIRRAYLDLIGMPPSYEEVEAFAGNDSHDAMTQMVDRLLARREYGERWARHWLDVARYADVKGYLDAGEQRFPFAYSYRDYVVRSLNEDLPFDRFLLEQIAADQLVEGGDTRPLAALGFLTVGSWYNLFPHEIIDDRIDVVARGLMGLTVGCARCHDHKYDPITTEDYYSLYGVFASSREPPPDEYPLLAEPGTSEDDAFREELQQAAQKYKQLRAELHAKIMHEMRAWSGDYLRYIVQTMPDHRTQAQAPLRTERGVIRDFSAYARGGVTRWRRFLQSRPPDDPVFGLWSRLIAMSREEIARRFPGALAEFETSGQANPLVLETFAGQAPKSMADLADLYGELLEETDTLWRKHQKDDSQAVAFDDPHHEQLRQALFGKDAPGTVSVDESTDLYTLNESVEVRTAFADVERVYLKAGKGCAPRAMVLVDRSEPVEPRVFLRGNAERPGKHVARQLPILLSDLRTEPFEVGSGRLELARAIVDPRNPLTARVIVNRIWAWHFGRGLVATPSDFGVRSAPPTHPQLLDYLASWLMDNDWSLKKLHRKILLSSTWQQASVDRPECRREDAENQLLWRMNRQRLDFETMRDSLLAVSGRLEPLRGGPPIEKRPDDVSNSARTLYSSVDRTSLPEICRVFDFPNPDLSAPQRSKTTMPQQALFLLNSLFVIAQSEAVAARLADEFDSDQVANRIRQLFRIVYSRNPSGEELELATRFVVDRLITLGERQPRPRRPNAWQYGFGQYEIAVKRLTSFTPLPHFTGEAWQGGPEWPDAELHYLRLTAIGGHVGIDRAHAAVRRWTAPIDGVITISGDFSHGDVEKCGDGVEGWIVSSRSGEVGHWTVFKDTVDTLIESLEVASGETIDFVVDCRENHYCDEFVWAPLIQALDSDGANTAEVREWDAAWDFSDEWVPTPSAWAELAQTLLQSNEFLFVD
jgi:hypothetical protein